MAGNGTFEAQSEPIADIKPIQNYCDWMAGLCFSPMAGCSFEVHASCWDDATRTALFFAAFTGTHVGDGGPRLPTNTTTDSHFAYAIQMDKNDKVISMVKTWNAPWALRELGWVE